MRPARSIVSITLLGASALYACSSSTPGDDPFVDASVPDAAPPTLDAASLEDASLAADPLPAECEDAGEGNEPPQNLLCTKLYAIFATKTLAAGVMPYTPGYTLWSDGAKKNRWIYLPPGATIDATKMDEWTFPVGTKLWKEFRLDGKRIETRMFWKVSATGADAWTFAVYRWTDDQKSARRMDGGEGNIGGTSYEIPSRSQCKSCHSGRQDRILGFDAIALAAPGASGLTMNQLVATGRISPPPTSSLVVPDDGTGRAAPAMGWLHANCGTACHNGNPEALANGTGLRLRINVAQLASGKAQDLDVFATAVGVKALRSDLAGMGFYRIKPGDASMSALPFAAGNRSAGSFQMPPILSHLADTQNVQAMRDWIGAMPKPDGG